MRAPLRYSIAFAVACVSSTLGAQTTLGSITLNNSQFGNSVVASDGGANFAANWLNTTNVNPGLVAGLTTVGFNSGVANIAFSGGPLSYTIGYTTPITNQAGTDFAVIVARYSADPVYLSVSENGTSFGVEQLIAASTAINTGESKAYYYAGGGPYTAQLWAHLLDLSSFGIANGSSVSAIRVRATTELDLIRVAGMNSGDMSTVPEPSSWALMGTGALGLITIAAARRRRA